MNGLFEVTPNQIASITDGARFTDVCNRLIEAEASATRIPPSDVHTTYKTWDPDRGLDAIVNAPAEHDSRWIPPGRSGWQFKIRRPTDTQLQDEFDKPNVQALLKDGGTYVMLVADGQAADLQAQAQDRLNELSVEGV